MCASPAGGGRHHHHHPPLERGQPVSYSPCHTRPGDSRVHVGGSRARDRGRPLLARRPARLGVSLSLSLSFTHSLPHTISRATAAGRSKRVDQPPPRGWFGWPAWAGRGRAECQRSPPLSPRVPPPPLTRLGERKEDGMSVCAGAVSRFARPTSLPSPMVPPPFRLWCCPLSSRRRWSCAGRSTVSLSLSLSLSVCVCV